MNNIQSDIRINKLYTSCDELHFSAWAVARLNCGSPWALRWHSNFLFWLRLVVVSIQLLLSLVSNSFSNLVHWCISCVLVFLDRIVWLTFSEKWNLHRFYWKFCLEWFSFCLFVEKKKNCTWNPKKLVALLENRHHQIIRSSANDLKFFFITCASFFIFFYHYFLEYEWP